MEILQPIHEKQKRSEDNRATLGYVAQWWSEVYIHLNTISQGPNSFAADIQSFLNISNGKAWKERVDRQLTWLHTAAFFLWPSNYSVPISDKQQDQILDLFMQYIPEQYSTAFKQF